MKKNRAKNGLYSYLWALAVKTILKMIHFSSIIKSMRHFLGSVGVHGSVRGQFLPDTPFPCVRVRCLSVCVKKLVPTVFFSRFHVCVIRIGLRDVSVISETESLLNNFSRTTDTTHSKLHPFKHYHG